jgi:hypothetical protein
MRVVRKSLVSSGILDGILAKCTGIIHLESNYPLYVTLGAAVGSHFHNKPPVWLMLVGPPSCGKSMMLSMVSKIPGMYECGSMTGEAAFLTAQKRVKGSGNSNRPTGGILAGLPMSVEEPGKSFGILTTKDFTTVLTKNPDRRAEILSCLREVADGAWTRTVGVDGGGSLTWTGKCGFVGGVTNEIDKQYAVIQSLGDRWVYWRYHRTNNYAAINLAMTRTEVPSDLCDVVADTLIDAGLREGMAVPDDLSVADLDRLTNLAQFVSDCRISIARSNWDKAQYEVGQVEVPIRVAFNMVNIYHGMTWLGIARHDKWKVIYRMAMDSMPNSRSHVIKQLLTSDVSLNANQLATIIGLGPSTALYALQDLRLAGVTQFEKSVVRDGEMKWGLTENAISILHRVRRFVTMSEEEYMKSEINLD